MAEHTIEIPDLTVGDELRWIVWNDETGEVSGDHSYVQFIQSTIEDAPVERGDGGRIWRLEGPGRNPEEFLVLIWLANWRVLIHDDLRATLPAIFDDVELPLGEKAEDLYIEDPETGELVLAE